MVSMFQELIFTFDKFSLIIYFTCINLLKLAIVENYIHIFLLQKVHHDGDLSC